MKNTKELMDIFKNRMMKKRLVSKRKKEEEEKTRNHSKVIRKTKC